MTFKKNFLVLLVAVVLVLTGSYLLGISRSVIVDGMTLVIATVSLALLLEDFWRKMLEDRDKLTWEYFVGAALVVGSIVAFLWASQSVETKEMVARLGVTFFLGGLGGFWFSAVYKKSTQSQQTRDESIWAKTRKKIPKIKDRDRLQKTLYKALRYRLVSDRIDGDLDPDRPLIRWKQELLTYEEALSKDEPPDSGFCDIRDRAGVYIKMLADQMPVELDELEDPQEAAN